MKRQRFAIAFVLMGITGGAWAQTRPLTSFETPADLEAVKATHSNVSLTSEHATDGKHALKVEFLPAEWPGARVAASAAWDWRPSGGLAIDVHNPGNGSVAFGVRVDDDLKADGIAHCRTGRGVIEPGKTVTFLMQWGPDPMAVGMRGLPTYPGMRGLGANGSGPFDLSHIVSYQIFMHQPDTPKTLIIDHVRLVPPLPLTKIVDAYGQYTGADWPGKLKSDQQFETTRLAEAAELAAHPALPDRDKYGGWANGPTLRATGFFRTEKRDGKWWLVTPEGHLFFSFGFDTMRSDMRTFTQGRETLFSWLPDKSDPLAKHIGVTSHIHSGPVQEGADFNFYEANLERKYGAAYPQAWLDSALARLPAWGFNTIGNWEDPRFFRNGRVPYVATAGVSGDHARVSSGSDYWAKMHDPFDPRFEADVRRNLQQVAPLVKGDPYCLGYFVDNELSWAGNGDEGRYGLAYGALALPAAESPAKQAFLTQLKSRYRESASLNAAWGTSFAGWEALDAPFKPAGPANAAMKADLAAYVKEFARHYFRVVKAALKQVDPDHLYLGCRFAWHGREEVEAAAEFCDVISFNIYAPRLEPARWAYLTELDRPCLIGEFHFGALDRGLFHTGLVAAPNQQARAELYSDYVRSVLDHPAFVGCHWFQYIDEPLTGRTWDGENYNIGFLTVTDTPYPEMVAAAKRVHAEAYPRRAGRRAGKEAAP